MEVIAIGDMHAQTRGPDDDFGKDGAADKALIQLTEDYPDARFIFSEAFECQQSLRHERRKENIMSAIWHAHSDALEALWSRTEAWIVGNHDARLLGMKWHGLECLPHLVWDGTLFIHGHQFDPMITKHPHTCARLADVAGWLERHVDSDFDLWVSKVQGWLSGTGRHGGEGRNEKYWPAVADTAWEHGCNTAVFGHTHQKDQTYMGAWEGSRELFHIDLFNTGHWTNGSRDVTRMEV